MTIIVSVRVRATQGHIYLRTNKVFIDSNDVPVQACSKDWYTKGCQHNRLITDKAFVLRLTQVGSGCGDKSRACSNDKDEYLQEVQTNETLDTEKISRSRIFKAAPDAHR